jgi:hypothetical protein
LQREEGRPDYAPPSSFNKRLKITKDSIIFGLEVHDEDEIKWGEGKFELMAVAEPLVIT